MYDGNAPGRFNEISFMLTAQCIQHSIQSRPKILEPIYGVTVSLPSEYMGDVFDLQTRRALIMGMDRDKYLEKIKARVPLKEMSSYATSLSSITGGRASFTMKFAAYELVPSDIQEKLLKEYEASEKE